MDHHNILNQLYRAKDTPRPRSEKRHKRQKVDALKEIVSDLTGAVIETHNEKVGEKNELHGIVIVTVDSMASRKAIFKACKFKVNIPMYIDARSGGDGALIYAFDPRDIDHVTEYEETLYDDEGAIPAPCATQETVPILWTIAPIIARLIVSSFQKGRILYSYTTVNMENLLRVSTVEVKE